MNKTSRREFLRSAGGLSFLALVPVGRGFFAEAATPNTAIPSGATRSGGAQPLLFTALPYIQPGDNSVLVDGKESSIIAWQTQHRDASFVVHYGLDKNYGRIASIARTERLQGDANQLEDRFNYAAHLTGLRLGTRTVYRVECNGKTIAEGYFSTRKPRGRRTRFVSFGDNSHGDISDRAIAYQAYRANPDFVMNTGDNVYDGGLDNEYARFFFPVYNADVAHPRIGAPLLRSVPFYSVIANHDVVHRDANKHPIADFDKDPDSLAYYTNLHLPLNGLETPSQPTPIAGKPEAVGVFRKAAGARFPRMANYAFDYGDAHFLCLDSNIYVDPTDARLQAWIERDLESTDASWKFVVYHHPAFNVGDDHYAEQHMRVLQPLWERHGVDIVLNGHEHTYQRARPLRFAPADTGAAAQININKRLVPGRFSIDRFFDGARQTRPDGVLHIVTGAGGKQLYDRNHNNNPAKWRHEEDNNLDYVSRFVSDRHSLTVFDMDQQTLEMTQIDEYGETIDAIRITQS